MVKKENAILPAWELRSLPPEQSLSAELLAARDDRKHGVQYRRFYPAWITPYRGVPRSENSASFEK